MIDYRNLLRKYMRKVLNEEGVSFVKGASCYDRGNVFTDEEQAALEAVEQDALADYHYPKGKPPDEKETA